jgi:hypothetical protein
MNVITKISLAAIGPWIILDSYFWSTHYLAPAISWAFGVGIWAFNIVYFRRKKF